MLDHLSSAVFGTLILFCVPVEAAWHSDTQPIMGTRVHVEFWLDDADTRGPLLLASAMEEMLRIDFAFSPYKESSELSRMNREAPKGWVAISPEMKVLLDRSREAFRALQWCV